MVTVPIPTLDTMTVCVSVLPTGTLPKATLLAFSGLPEEEVAGIWAAGEFAFSDEQPNIVVRDSRRTISVPREPNSVTGASTHRTAIRRGI